MNGISTWKAVLAAAGFSMAVLAAFQAGGTWERLDGLLFDAFTVVASHRPAEASPVVVVGIDEPSFAALRQRWPWPRSLHARLVEELKRAGASVVVFDLVFSEPSTPGDDAAFARAVHAARNVVLAEALSFEETARSSGPQRVELLPELREAGAAPGLVTLEAGADQVVRRFPADAEAMWRVALQRHRAAVRARGVPVDVRRGDMVRYSDGSDVHHVSYYQALDTARWLPPRAFEGRIAVVGLVPGTSPAAPPDVDTFDTPFLRFSRQRAPGVEIQAQFIAAAHAGRVIVPLQPEWTWVLAAAVIGIGSALLRQWSALRAAAYAGAVLVASVGATYALFVSGVYLAVMPVMGGALALLAARGITAWRDERRRRDEIRRDEVRRAREESQ